MEMPRELIQSLMDADEVSKRAWYKRITARWRAAKCAYDKKVVALSFAVELGLDPRPYSSQKEREKVPKLLAEIQKPQTILAPVLKQGKTPTRTKRARGFIIDESLNGASVNLTASKMHEGVEMAQTYYRLYIFENSLRQFIIEVMAKQFGSNWWKLQVNKKTRERAADRETKEKANRWHGLRGDHPIYYVDISDYKRILSKNWKTAFEPIFPGLPRSMEWILNRIDEIILSRNIIAHMNPLPKRDRKRVEIYLEDWLAQIGC